MAWTPARKCLLRHVRPSIAGRRRTSGARPLALATCLICLISLAPSSLSTCSNTLHYFPQPAPTIAGFKRLLAAEGQLVLEDFARHEASFPWRAFDWLLRQSDPDHVQAYSLTE